MCKKIMAGPTVKEGAAMIHCMCKGLAKKWLVSLWLLEEDEEEEEEHGASESASRCWYVLDRI